MKQFKVGMYNNAECIDFIFQPDSGEGIVSSTEKYKLKVKILCEDGGIAEMEAVSIYWSVLESEQSDCEPSPGGDDMPNWMAAETAVSNN